MFRSLPLFLNGVLLLAVLGSAACSHCEATFVVPEDAQYWCTEDTGNQQAAFFNNCEEDEDLFSGCSPMERCNYINEQVPFVGTACVAKVSKSGLMEIAEIHVGLRKVGFNLV
ncbi:MAG TPA: hypothetical protein PLA94_04460 [Myxococcota bacterium]|nr:hypothetical protein [Myxococcota bacterium]